LTTSHPDIRPEFEKIAATEALQAAAESAQKLFHFILNSLENVPCSRP
jgi:hypothetical protein